MNTRVSTIVKKSSPKNLSADKLPTGYQQFLKKNLMYSHCKKQNSLVPWHVILRLAIKTGSFYEGTTESYIFIS